LPGAASNVVEGKRARKLDAGRLAESETESAESESKSRMPMRAPMRNRPCCTSRNRMTGPTGAPTSIDKISTDALGPYRIRWIA
jgi:hypothetical protein